MTFVQTCHIQRWAIHTTVAYFSVTYSRLQCHLYRSAMYTVKVQIIMSRMGSMTDTGFQAWSGIKNWVVLITVPRNCCIIPYSSPLQHATACTSHRPANAIVESDHIKCLYLSTHNVKRGILLLALAAVIWPPQANYLGWKQKAGVRTASISWWP